MQRNSTARRSCAPEIHSTLPVTVTPDSAQSESTIALRAIGNRKTAIVAGAIVLVGLFVWVPTLAAGLLFGGALFGVNTLVDGKMGGRDHD
jgi:hypothetical protein